MYYPSISIIIVTQRTTPKCKGVKQIQPVNLLTVLHLGQGLAGAVGLCQPAQLEMRTEEGFMQLLSRGGELGDGCTPRSGKV